MAYNFIDRRGIAIAQRGHGATRRDAVERGDIEPIDLSGVGASGKHREHRVEIGAGRIGCGCRCQLRDEHDAGRIGGQCLCRSCDGLLGDRGEEQPGPAGGAGENGPRGPIIELRRCGGDGKGCRGRLGCRSGQRQKRSQPHAAVGMVDRRRRDAVAERLPGRRGIGPRVEHDPLRCARKPEPLFPQPGVIACRGPVEIGDGEPRQAVEDAEGVDARDRR